MRLSASVRRDGLAVDALAFLGEPLDEAGAVGDLALGLGERLALLGGHDARQVVRRAACSRSNHLHRIAAALLAGLVAPGRPGARWRRRCAAAAFLRRRGWPRRPACGRWLGRGREALAPATHSPLISASVLSRVGSLSGREGEVFMSMAVLHLRRPGRCGPQRLLTRGITRCSRGPQWRAQRSGTPGSTHSISYSRFAPSSAVLPDGS